MTGQVADSVTYKGKRYVLCGCNGTGFFEPRDHGLNPAMASTGCYRGWMGEFVVLDSLVLNNLFVFHDAGLPVKNKRPNGPPINTIEPCKPKSLLGFNCAYTDVAIPVPFTGGLLIAEGYTHKSFFNMGYPQFWQFEFVLELMFEKGMLQSAEDQSEVAKIIRERHLVPRLLGREMLSDDASVKKWIEDSFSLNYSFELKNE